MSQKIIELENATLDSRKEYVPSKIHANSLFNFMTKLDFLINIVKTKRISARYCEEDLEYLKIPNLRKIALPMKCFCDINMHKLEYHLEWYGYYGLAFSKEWGIQQGVQPVQYINQYSNLILDFVEAFKSALIIKPADENSSQTKMKSFLLLELMYYKPHDGLMENRNTRKKERKCFTDECEWRYIPNVIKAGFHQVLRDEAIINAGVLERINNGLEKAIDVALQFKYEDLKYIIIKDNEDYTILLKEINNFNISYDEKCYLISKIIVWENSKGDF